MNWIHKTFNELTNTELYEILRLRNEVFVVEQGCVYQDLDNKDQKSVHLMGWLDGKLAAYARLLPAGISYAEISIGRIVTSPNARGTGLGKLLIARCIELSYELHGKSIIRIGAQYQLIDLYATFGFRTYGERYLEDGIQHIEMVLPA